MKCKFFTVILISSALIISTLANARGVYQTREAFLHEAFNGPPPKAKVIWLSGEIKKNASEILQHKPGFLRVRFWAVESKSAWVLNEVGKEQPITIGIVIENKKIKRLSVLEYRESRGNEVRHHFFTKQFVDLQLNTENQLSKNIDGITGATLSVRALKRLAKLALYLDSKRKDKAQ
jgi:hypothetical protein